MGPEYGFGLYVHWPYCARICPYCDFNVYAAKNRDTSPLVDAMVRDLEAHADRLEHHPALDTIFFGGGTPSLMSVAQIERIVTAAQATFGLKPDAEITLEANPNDILKADIQGWRSAGINRLSIGVQSLDDDALRFLGRDHDAMAARKAIELALGVFPSVSIDLIYARPGQTSTDWENELTASLKLGAHHLSLYELTIEERTAFGKAAARGNLVPMPDDDQASLYELTDALTTGAGYPAYEVSNYAVSQPHQSRHNMIYWQSGDWIGLGPGAHGRLTIDGKRIATETALKPSAYVSSSNFEREDLSATDISRELLAMGLRPTRGIELARLENINSEELEALKAMGFVGVSNARLHTTPAGRLLTDAIVARLAP